MTTVHIIFNAHLDPIWLWSWRGGLDEALNTGYYMCDLLDRHPDIIFTRGEGWFYEQVRKVDPVLFGRIQRHVQAGRWSPVGGWFIQPDCNLPSGFALERQIAIGAQQFREYFGRVPRVAYNVDSFGHAATLPGFIRGAGQRFYVMMRPQEHETALPARLFRWRGYRDGPEVTTFRIAQSYCTPAAPGAVNSLDEKYLRASLTELPKGVSHTMCFVGIGDHGGGPTESMIAWCREHRDSFPGIRLVFSSPEKFFTAIRSDIAKLPLVVGELQMHAVGCYTIHRQVKTMLRKAEHRLMQAEATLQGRPSGEERRALELAWKRVCFHQFHDTICGTCLPSAYEDVHAELGQALATAEEVATFSLRKRLVALPKDPAQRIVHFNASDHRFDDYVEVEPHLDWTRWQSSWRIVDEKCRMIPVQVIAPESGGTNEVRLLFPLTVRPRTLQTLRIVQGPDRADDIPNPVVTGRASLTTPDGPSLEFGSSAPMRFPAAPSFALPDLALYDDHSDTWSHGVDRYPRRSREAAAWKRPRPLDQGPLMGSFFQSGRVGASPVQAEWRIFRGKPWIDCLLRVVWVEQHRVLKLEWKMPGVVMEREDGIMGGSLKRMADGRELPMRDWTRVRVKSKVGQCEAAVIAPEVFALDVEPDRLRLTLLRSAVMACEDADRDVQPHSVFSDRGEHWFRFRFWAAPRLAAEDLEAVGAGLQRPLLTASLTRGMTTRALRGSYVPSVILR